MTHSPARDRLSAGPSLLRRALFGLAVVAPLAHLSPVALACSGPASAPQGRYFLPKAGAVVPANVPNIGFVRGGLVAAPSVDCATLVDRGGVTVPTARWPSPAGDLVLQPLSPLAVGESYTVTSACAPASRDGGGDDGGLDGGGPLPTEAGATGATLTAFTAGPPSPLPTALGKLELLSLAEATLSDPSPAKCYGPLPVKLARLRFTPDPSLVPFAQVADVKTATFDAAGVIDRGRAPVEQAVAVSPSGEPTVFEVTLRCGSGRQPIKVTGGLVQSVGARALEVSVDADTPCGGGASDDTGCSTSGARAGGRGALALLLVAVSAGLARRARPRRGGLARTQGVPAGRRSS